MAKELEMSFKMNLVTVPTMFGDIKFEREDPNEELEMAVDFMLKNPQLMIAQSNQLPNKSISITEADNSAQSLTIRAMTEKWAIVCSKLSQKEQESHNRYMQILLYMYGDAGIVFNKKQINELLRVSKRMPLGNRNPYTKMSMDERIELALQDEVPDEDQITNSKHALKTFQGFFNWLVTEEYIESSPMKLRTIKAKMGEDRGAFDIPTSKKIIDYAKNTSNLNLKWPLLIMAYSGMRNNEIQKLRKQDIRRCTKTGIYFMQIQFSKTEASTRKIPIAQPLINLGFMTFVDSFKKETDRLFDVSERYLTSRYPEIRKLIGLDERDEMGCKLSLYSFRHTVISLIRANGANEFLTKAIAGHKSSKKGDAIHDKYSHIFLIPLEKLKLILDGLLYEVAFPSYVDDLNYYEQ